MIINIRHVRSWVNNTQYIRKNTRKASNNCLEPCELLFKVTLFYRLSNSIANIFVVLHSLIYVLTIAQFRNHCYFGAFFFYQYYNIVNVFCYRFANTAQFRDPFAFFHKLYTVIIISVYANFVLNGMYSTFVRTFYFLMIIGIITDI